MHSTLTVRNHFVLTPGAMQKMGRVPSNLKEHTRTHSLTWACWAAQSNVPHLAFADVWVEQKDGESDLLKFSYSIS
jgi:hypothetical protein